MTYKVMATVEHEFTEQEIWYQIVGAFEGGSNYWIESVDEQTPKDYKRIKPSEMPWMAMKDIEYHTETKTYAYTSQLPVLGGSFTIQEMDGYNHNPNPINHETIKAGLAIMAEKAPKHFHDMIEETGDAITSDVFLQMCAFGEIIYG